MVSRFLNIIPLFFLPHPIVPFSQVKENGGNQLPVCSQKASLQARCSGAHQGDNTACSSEGFVSGRLHSWCGATQASGFLQVCVLFWHFFETVWGRPGHLEIFYFWCFQLAHGCTFTCFYFVCFLLINIPLHFFSIQIDCFSLTKILCDLTSEITKNFLVVYFSKNKSEHIKRCALNLKK